MGSCGWLAVMADVAIEEKKLVLLQRSKRMQGAAVARACLVWVLAVGPEQLAGRQEAQKPGLLVPAAEVAHGCDDDHVAAAAVAAAQMFEAARVVAAQS